MIRVIFMGTPDFAAVPLNALISSDNIEVALVVTQPDKEVGRRREIIPSPVKQVALKNQIEIFQPQNFKNKEDVDFLRKYEADMIVVAAYGNILPEDVLLMPPMGCINVHASLLPKYRGAAPIQWAIINNEKKTGVTIMRMDKGLDTGDIISSRECEIAFDETAETLFEKLSLIGTELLMETIPLIAEGKAVYTKQDESLATKVGMIKKTDALMDLLRTPEELDAFIRGMSGWPVAYGYLNGKALRIHSARASGMIFDDGSGRSPEPGFMFTEGKKIFLACKGGSIELITLQPEGKKVMSPAECINGRIIKTGDRLEGKQ